MSAPSSPPPPGQRPETPQNIATAIAEVSERATLLVHEEIELAKAEVTEKATKLIRGAIVGVAAGIFFVMALIFVQIGWHLNKRVQSADYQAAQMRSVIDISITENTDRGQNAKIQEHILLCGFNNLIEFLLDLRRLSYIQSSGEIDYQVAAAFFAFHAMPRFLSSRES